MHEVEQLSNEELVARLRAHVGKGHVWQAALIAYLAEVEGRKAYAELACPSMWDFCVRKLGMSESEAQRRIAAARVVRQFPLALGFLERGEIRLCSLYALRDHLTDENHRELLREATHKSTREVEAIIAARFPRPDIVPCIEPLAPQVALRGPAVASGARPPAAYTAASASASASAIRSKVEPLSATRYRVELTISAAIRSKLERIKDLTRHRNPTGDLETILDASLGLLLAKLEKERLGKTSRPRPRRSMRDQNETQTRASDPGLQPQPTGDPVSRARVRAHEDGEAKARPPTAPAHARQPGHRKHISREVRRHVFARDGEQCSYVDAAGHRCPARAYLELDHIHPKALGGTDEAENLRVRCRTHNHLYAVQVFGRAHVEERIHSPCRKYGPATPRPLGAPRPAMFDMAARGLRNLGFRWTEVRRALATLETKLDAQASVETILRQALLLLT